MPRQYSANTIKKMKLSQQARRLREQENKRTIPVYEGKQLVKRLDMGSGTDGFINLLKKSKVKHRKPKKSGTGCILQALTGYCIIMGIMFWLNSGTEITYKPTLVEAKNDTVSEVKIEEVKIDTQEIKIEPEPILEGITPIFDSSEEDLRNYIELKFAPLGDEAVEWALFTANQESRFMASPHNMQDDHSSWCNLENGSHGLFHFSTCTYKGLGGVDIMNPYEQIDIVSRPEVYAKRSFYWVYSTSKFESR